MPTNVNRLILGEGRKSLESISSVSLDILRGEIPLARHFSTHSLRLEATMPMSCSSPLLPLYRTRYCISKFFLLTQNEASAIADASFFMVYKATPSEQSDCYPYLLLRRSARSEPPMRRSRPDVGSGTPPLLPPTASVQSALIMLPSHETILPETVAPGVGSITS